MKSVKICEYKGHWCDGKHIPLMKKTGKFNNKGYSVFSDIDTNKKSDKEPCTYFIDSKCTK